MKKSYAGFVKEREQAGNGFVDHRKVAGELDVAPQTLRRMAARGSFPPIVSISDKILVVSREAFAAWKKERGLEA